MGKLNNKVAIVTGAGSGIGRAIAIELAKEGADLVICGRTMSKLEEVASEIRATGRSCLAIQTDVSVRKDVENMVKQTVNKFKTIDILVNNAAVIKRAHIPEITEKDWDDLINVNLKGVFLCMQEVAKYMISKKNGNIINISSISGRGGGLKAGPAYCASKAGVVGLTQAAAWDLGPHGINVNSIAPGLIITPMSSSGRTKEEYEVFTEEQKRATVLRRLGVPQDIAKVVVFLASDDSSFISGQIIPVDGGRTNRM